MGLATTLLIFAWLACVAGSFLPIWNFGTKDRIIFSTILCMALTTIGVLEFHFYEPPLTAADVARKMAGEGKFCFVEAMIINRKNFNSPVPLKVTNLTDLSVPKLQFFISPYWIHGKVNEYPTEYHSIMKQAESISCDVGSYSLGVVASDGFHPISLIPGRYRVEFTTSLGNVWYETLTIEQSFDELVSVVDVFIPGQASYRSPRPPGYVEW